MKPHRRPVPEKEAERRGTLLAFWSVVVILAIGAFLFFTVLFFPTPAGEWEHVKQVTQTV